MRQGFFGKTTSDMIISLFCLLLSFYNLIPTYKFLLLAIKEFERRLYLMHGASDLLTERLKGFRGRKSALPPIEYLCPLNMTHWFTLRKIAKDIGFSFVARLQIFSSLILFMTILMAAFLFSQIIIGTNDRVSIVLVFFSTVMALVPLIICVKKGERINSQGQEHSKILLQQQTVILEIITLKLSRLLDRTEIGKLRSTCRIIAAMLPVLRLDDESLSILGFSVGANTTRIVASLAVTVVGFGLRLVTNI